MEKVPCPCCRSLSPWKDNPFRPFCSETCKNRDLGKWANEEYRVPLEEEGKLAQASEPAPVAGVKQDED